MPKTKNTFRKSKTSKRKTKKLKLKIQKDYIVAIHTYKRYEQVYDKSMKTLLNGKVPANKIYIFVANKQEEKEYREKLPKGSYKKIVVGIIGITNQRKFMVKYFKPGTKVLFLDDDVERVDKLSADGKKFNKVSNVDKFIKDSFKECEKYGLFLWGVYPVRNELFMKSRPKKSYGLRFILGTFYGQIIRHNKKLVPSAPEKEDFEQSILHYIMDGGVFRQEKYTIKTKFFNPKGGIAAMSKDRKKVNKGAAEYLEKKYGDYGKKWQRGDGRWEFRLKSFPYEGNKK